MLQNRKFFPKTLLKEDKTLNIGEYDFAISGEIFVFKWADRGKNLQLPFHPSIRGMMLQ